MGRIPATGADSPATAGGPNRGRNALIFAAVVAAATVALFYGKGRIAPPMPRDLEHLASAGSRSAEACLACHRQGASAMPRPPGHTSRQDCGGCHLVAAQQ